MLFNSYQFLLFLPIVAIGFYAIGEKSRNWALRWLILSSIFFYGWWNPVNIAIILPSVLVNYMLARLIDRWAGDTGRQRLSALTLYAGLIFNLCFLGYFKYKNFFLTTLNDVVGTNIISAATILPLGISFITFQKIAFLFDVRGRRVKSFNFQDYCTFVFFFPQLIAGPIVHYNEMLPQFGKPAYRPDWNNIAVGLTLFSMGLFKKLIFADSIAPYVSVFYADAAAGHSVALLQAWLAAIGFTLQIYFDFSGYSDMAIGLARVFGIRLPANFNSPLKATSIIDFWTRWHMTLTRFLTAYLYNPMALAVTRRRAARSLPGLAGNRTTYGAFVVVLMLPLLVTMSLAGLWHGAGWNYVIFGALHGIYLTVNHGWRLFRPKGTPGAGRHTRIATPAAAVLVFGSVVFANVFFRSSSLSAAVVLVKGLVGLNGVTLPQTLLDRLGMMGEWLHGMGVEPVWWSGYGFTVTLLWVGVLLAVALVPPNTLQIMARFEPALGTARPAQLANAAAFVWKPSLSWALYTGAIAAVSLLSLGTPAAFLYWQF
jgi:alginate O-acetyltransferase complex protein AlgI